jgi:hypothetical protein
MERYGSTLGPQEGVLKNIWIDADDSFDLNYFFP